MPFSIKRAFTLVELMVVFGIIALLAAILFPTLSIVRENSRRTACLSNLRQLGMAIHLYAQDYDEYLPYAHSCSLTDSSRNISPVLSGYVKSPLIFQCPSEIPDHQAGHIYPNLSYYQLCGSNYQYNEWNGLFPTRLSYFQVPSQSFLMGDGAGYHDWDAYLEGNGHWNLLYMDGHTKYVSQSERMDALDLTERKDTF